MDKLLKNNLALRIIALVFSCILWVSVSLQNNGNGVAASGVSEKFPYSVHVLVSPNMVVTAIDNPTATVVVHGDSVNVASLPAEMLNTGVQADARGLTPGQHTLRLVATGMPQVNYSIDPTTVNVVIENKVTVNKVVHVYVQGKAAEGYNVGDAVADLQSVQVSGVQSAVDKVAFVETMVSIQGATQTVTKAGALRPVDNQGTLVSGVDVNPVNATVTVPVQPPQVTVGVVPQIVGTPSAGYAVAGVDLNPTTVLVAGSPTSTSNLTAVPVSIDVSGFRATQTLREELPVPSGITRLTPNTISATVKIEAAETKTFTDVPITLKNVPGDLHVTLTGPSSVNVTVSGPKSAVENLQASGVSVYVDASRLKAGDNSVGLTVSLPDWLQVTEMSSHIAQVSAAQ